MNQKIESSDGKVGAIPRGLTLSAALQSLDQHQTSQVMFTNLCSLHFCLYCFFAFVLWPPIANSTPEDRLVGTLDTVWCISVFHPNLDLVAPYHSPMTRSTVQLLTTVALLMFWRRVMPPFPHLHPQNTCINCFHAVQVNMRPVDKLILKTN